MVDELCLELVEEYEEEDEDGAGAASRLPPGEGVLKADVHSIDCGLPSADKEQRSGGGRPLRGLRLGSVPNEPLAFSVLRTEELVEEAFSVKSTICWEVATVRSSSSIASVSVPADWAHTSSKCKAASATPWKVTCPVCSSERKHAIPLGQTHMSFLGLAKVFSYETSWSTFPCNKTSLTESNFSPQCWKKQRSFFPFREEGLEATAFLRIWRREKYERLLVKTCSEKEGRRD